MITCTRYHDFSSGHIVTGHEGKCNYLHGHNYRIHFTVTAAELDAVGRIMDFSVINTRLCQWTERHWDHKFLVWSGDPRAAALQQIDHTVVLVPFVPTAENIAQNLLDVVGPQQLKDTGVTLIKVTVEETRKCAATAVSESSLADHVIDELIRKKVEARNAKVFDYTTGTLNGEPVASGTEEAPVPGPAKGYTLPEQNHE